MAYNVLIVDDSSVVRKVLIKTFGLTNIEVSNFIQAENGQVGLKQLSENWVDIIFLDINMPVMNGLEFIAHLKANKDLRDIPIVVVSTEGSKERQEDLMKYGVKAYLRKPVSPEDLAKTIRNILGEAKHE